MKVVMGKSGTLAEDRLFSAGAIDSRTKRRSAEMVAVRVRVTPPVGNSELVGTNTIWPPAGWCSIRHSANIDGRKRSCFWTEQVKRANGRQ